MALNKNMVPKKGPDSSKNQKKSKNLFGLILISGLIFFILWLLLQNQLSEKEEFSPDEFYRVLLLGPVLEDGLGQIVRMEMEGESTLKGELGSGKEFEVIFPPGHLSENFEKIKEEFNRSKLKGKVSEREFISKLREAVEKGKGDFLLNNIRQYLFVKDVGEIQGGKSKEQYVEVDCTDEGVFQNLLVTLEPGEDRLDWGELHLWVKKYNEKMGTDVKIPPPEIFSGQEKSKNLNFSEPSQLLTTLLITLGPWALIIAFFYFVLFRQMRAPGAGGGILSFGRSRARLASREHTNITFDDVAGVDEAKEEVKEIIAFLKNPTHFQRLGGRIPRGVLLVGPPGTGKTLLAKAIAGEADVPFFSICGSDFVEMFVGVGASRVRDLFKQAKENSPCLIFLDEVDAVGRRRGSGLGGGHDEREQTLNAILVEMDGFDTDEGIILIAATNRPDVLDPALLRPGRFDREIVLDFPDLKGREEILKVHARHVKLGPDVDLKILARGTPSFSGADLEATINEAAIIAVMKEKEYIEMEDLEEGRDKVKWGRQKTSRVMDEEDLRITAVHESGHALVASLLPEVEPLHKVSIIPRGMALGFTMTLPEKDIYHMQKKRLLGNITVLFAGRVAEEVFCKDISAGAKDDIKRATEVARYMVCEWGMSEKIGPINYSQHEEHIFLGRELTRTKAHSEKTSVEIDEEVERILLESYERAKTIITEHSKEIEAIYKALIKYEILTREEVKMLIRGEDFSKIKENAIPRKGEASIKKPEITGADRSQNGAEIPKT